MSAPQSRGGYSTRWPRPPLPNERGSIFVDGRWWWDISKPEALPQDHPRRAELLSRKPSPSGSGGAT